MKEKGLSKTRIEQLGHFADIAVEQDWDEGTNLDRPGMAAVCGWSVHVLDQVRRAIKEYPEYGLSISTRRGTNPHTVVSFDGSKLPTGSTAVVDMISQAKAKENFLRLVRDACTSFVAFRNSDKSLMAGRDMKRYHNRTKAFLMSLRETAVADGDVYQIKDLIERALVVAGVRYEDDE